jgi:hypothetical protein
MSVIVDWYAHWCMGRKDDLLKESKSLDTVAKALLSLVAPDSVGKDLI